MAEYVPLYMPGVAITRQASATITGGQVVAVSGSGTVGPAGAATAAWVGVAAFDAVSGDSLDVFCGGVQKCTASGAVTAGDIVVTGAAGTVATNATPGAGQQVGIALTTAANGAMVEVDFIR